MENGAKRASVILGVFMAIVLIAGVVIPLFTGNTTTTTPITNPTEAPVPTFPAPVSDLNSILFDQYYLHPTGLFIIAQPTGYEISQPNSALTIAQVNMVNQAALSVIDAYVEDPAGPITSAELDARFDQAALAQSWARFSNWEEQSRRMDGETLLIDFEVTLQNQTYVARQKVWTDGEWIYVVRVLAPENATNFLVYMLDNLADTLQPFKVFVGTPFDWQAYYDHQVKHIIRYPQTWFVADSAPGRPASITGTAGELLRVETQANTTIADEAAAQSWVESQRSGATILSVAPVTREDISGFSVAYTFSTADGAAQSALAVLLNGPDGTLHIANLRFAAEDVDLNNLPAAAETVVEATPEAEATVEPVAVDTTALHNQNLALVMSTFRLMPELNLSAASLPQATPTPLPTALPIEVTAEATSETSDLETTEEAAVATDEPTVEVVVTEETVTEEAATEEANEVTFEQLSATSTAAAEAEATAAP